MLNSGQLQVARARRRFTGPSIVATDKRFSAPARSLASPDAITAAACLEGDLPSTSHGSLRRSTGGPHANKVIKPKVVKRAVTPARSIRDDVLATIPKLRAFGISLSGNVDVADDLVQETLVRALAHLNSFQPGTNLEAWLFTILRNHFRSEYRKSKREVEDADGHLAGTLSSLPEQVCRIEFKELQQALTKIPTDQREALILVAASGFAYEEAAEICGCAVGTIKSRVNRARHRLAELLEIQSIDDFRPDQATLGIVAAASRL